MSNHAENSVWYCFVDISLFYGQVLGKAGMIDGRCVSDRQNYILPGGQDGYDYEH